MRYSPEQISESHPDRDTLRVDPERVGYSGNGVPDTAESGLPMYL